MAGLTGGLSLGGSFDVPLLNDSQELLNQPRIPLLSRALPQDGDRLLPGEPAAIRPIARHRNKSIRDGDDPREQWNVSAAEPVGIAGAVYALVMMTDGREQLIGARQCPQDLLAHYWVSLDLTELARVQTTSL